MIRISTVMAIPALLRELEVDPEEVLSEFGLNAGIFDDPDNLISYTVRSRLLERCAQQSHCQHFGLLVGQQDSLYSLGLVGLMMKFSPDIGSALNNLVRYFHLHTHGASVTLQIQRGIAVLGYRTRDIRVVTNRQINDGSLAALFNILCDLCRPGWKPREVWSTHIEPDNIDPYRKFFRVHPRFNAEQNAIVFSSSCLNTPLPEVHADLRRTVQKQVDLLAEQHRDNFPEQVRTVLRAAQFSGDLSADHVASLFSMHPRTLNRRLGSYGIGYRELVDDIRFETAQQMLRDSSLPVSEVSLVLHYADARSFIRAFRRWSGETPARWRAAQRQLRIASAK